MGTPLFIALTLVAVVLIAVAIDIPTTKWMFEYSPPRRKKPLWQILKDAVIQETAYTDETATQTRTDAEEITRLQRRHQAEIRGQRSGDYPP